MKYILGQKNSMTQIWRGEELVAVTEVKAGPCVVLQVKNKAKDGYNGVQLGFGDRKEKNIKKPQKGHFKDLGNFMFVKEFRLENGDAKEEIKRGDKINVATFTEGDIIKVTSISNGKGFQGVVKRHGFHGQKATHGHKDQERMSGSIGAGGVQHVFKGTRMGGRTGGEQVTISNLEVISIDETKGLIYIKGGIPGSRGTLVEIKGKGDLKIMSEEKEVEKAKEVIEETPVQNEIETSEETAKEN